VSALKPMALKTPPLLLSLTLTRVGSGSTCKAQARSATNDQDPGSTSLRSLGLSVNGCASVLSAIFATSIAMTLGFSSSEGRGRIVVARTHKADNCRAPGKVSG
jgi:hypothetical protein